MSGEVDVTALMHHSVNMLRTAVAPMTNGVHTEKPAISRDKRVNLGPFGMRPMIRLRWTPMLPSIVRVPPPDHTLEEPAHCN